MAARKKKTDREKFEALMAEFGIEPQMTDLNLATGHTTLALLGNEGKVTGYNGFMCEFIFDGAGQFIEAGVWE